MIYRIRNKIQKFWDMMTDREYKEAILETDRSQAAGNVEPYEFEFSIPKDKIREILRERIRELRQRIKYYTDQKKIEVDMDWFFVYLYEKILARGGIENIQWLASQLGIELETEEEAKINES